MQNTERKPTGEQMADLIEKAVEDAMKQVKKTSRPNDRAILKACRKYRVRESTVRKIMGWEKQSNTKKNDSNINDHNGIVDRVIVPEHNDVQKTIEKETKSKLGDPGR
jgi:DNA-binding protein YbaB